MNEDDLTPESETSESAPIPHSDDDTFVIAESPTADKYAEPPEPEDGAPSPAGEDWLPGDIDAALAAVATLSEIMPEREAEAEALADARQGTPSFVPEMQLPPLMTLKRGSIGSIIPALLLIGFGAWLTLSITSGTPPEPLLVAGLVVGGIVLTLLAEWIGTGRWSRGMIFFALLIVLVTAVIAFSIQPTGIDLVRAYPLLVVAIGIAMALSGLIARPVNSRLLAPGALVVFAGVVGLMVTLGIIPDNWLVIAVPLAPIVLVVVLIIWLLPLIFRRR